MTIDVQAQRILAGQDAQFAPLIRIPAAKLVLGQWVELILPLAISALILPQYVELNGAIIANPAASFIGVKINSVSAPTLIFGRDSTGICRFDGVVSKIYVALLAGTPADFYFVGIRNGEIFYSGNFMGAGTPDNSTTQGGTGE